jgi:hypothetical protein
MKLCLERAHYDEATKPGAKLKNMLSAVTMWPCGQ